jgi:hypothetical protein
MPRSATFDVIIGNAFSTPVSETTVPARKEATTRADAFLAALLLDRADTTGVSKGGPTCS